MQDKYLHTNCLATLANMAAHFRRLHSYVCQRLISLLCVLNKRRIRIVQQLKQTSIPVEGSFISSMYGFHKIIILWLSNKDDASREELEQDLSIVDEVLRMLLEILNAAFSHQLSSNQHLGNNGFKLHFWIMIHIFFLVYSMLHKKEVLEVLRRQATFQDVVANLDMVALSPIKWRMLHEIPDDWFYLGC